MHKSVASVLVFVLLTVLFSGCAPAPTHPPAPTATVAPAATETLAATETPRLRSGDGSEPVTLTFTNRSNETLTLYWVDFEGSEQPFGELALAATLEQETTGTHAWRLRDEAGNVIAEFAATEEKEQVIEIGPDKQVVYQSAPEAVTSVPFTDDFSDSSSGWDDSSNENGDTGYENGEYVIRLNKLDWFRWGNADEDNLSDIHIDVTAQSTGSASDATFGVICHYVDGDNYYYMGIGSDGYYTIAKDVGDDDETLSKGNDKVPQNQASYQLGVDCGHGTLTLYVNDQMIASVEDDTFTTGQVGLFAWSAEDANVEVHFDDFVVTALAD